MDITIPLKYNYQGKKLNYIHIGEGDWVVEQTGEPVDPKYVPMLETNAEKRIHSFNARNQVKIGDEVEVNHIVYTYNGTSFVDKEGNTPFDAAQAERIKQRMQNKAGGNADESTNDDSTEEKNDEKPEPKNDKGSDKQDSALQDTADIIKNHPKRARLITLIGRGDPISLLAVDIILSGKEKDAEQIIKNMK